MVNIQIATKYRIWMVTNFTLCLNFPNSALHCCHHSQNTFFTVFIENWSFLIFVRNLDGYQFTCLPYYDIVYYQFSIYDKVLGDFKMPLFILFCLWIIDRTSHRLILFADLVSLFEPLREWLIFLKIGVGT